MSRATLSGAAAAMRTELLAAIAIAGVLLFVNPYGEHGPESDRFFLLQALAAAGLFGLGIRALRGDAVDPRVPNAELAAERRIVRSPIVVAALAWGALSLLAGLAGVDRWRSLLGAPPRLAGTASELALLVLFLFWAQRFRDPVARERVDRMVALASSALVAYALLQWSGIDPIRWSLEWQGRPVAAQGNPLFLAQALVWIVPFLAARALALKAESRSSEAGATALLLALALAVAVRSGARGALLGIAAAALVAAVALPGARDAARAPGSRRVAPALAAVILAASALAAIWGFGRGAGLPGTAGQRSLLWRSTIDLLTQAAPARALVGYGQESLAIVLPPYLPPELPERIWRPDLYHDRAHNALLDALAAGGLLRALAGGALFTLAFAAAARRAARAELARDRWRAGALLAALTGHGVALTTGVATAATSLFYWLALALLAYQPSAGAAHGEARPRRRDAAAEDAGRRWTAMPGALVLLFAVFTAWIPVQVGESGSGAAPRAALLAAVVAALALLHAAAGELVALRTALTFGGAYAVAHLVLLRTAEPAIVLAAFVAAVVSVATWSLRGERRNTSGSRAPFVGAFLCAMAALLAAGVAAASASGVALKRGRTLLAAGEAAGAAADLARAARRAPWFEDGWISLARAEMRVAERSPEGGERDLRFAAAETDLAAAGSWHPRLPQIALERAHLLSRWGEATAEPEPRRARFDVAVERFREAIAMDPQNSAAHRGLGAALLALGDVAAAREALERSARLAPRSVEGRLMLARAALAAGDVESGRREIGEARAVDAARTRQILETLVRSRPRDVSAYRDLALLDLIEGRGAQARLALEQAMRIAEPNELGPLARLLSEAGAPR